MSKLVLCSIAIVPLLWSVPALAQGNPQCPTRPSGDSSNACASTAFVQQNSGGGISASKVIYVSTVGSDANSGLNWTSAKATIQNAIDTVASNGQVVIGSGSYLGQVNMRPAVSLNCVPGATITQANGANIATLINFATFTANGASIQNCTIDGNRANNTDNANDILIFGATANDVTLSNNTIQNGNGVGIDFSTGLRPIITYNKFTNFYTGPIYVNTGVTQETTWAQINNNWISEPIGQHAITLNDSDQNIITGNVIFGTLTTGIVINTSGTTVTWVSGPTFTGFHPGEFIILNGGSEFLITQVNSSTSLTVNTTPGTLTSVPAAVGPGDLISIGAASFNNIIGNTIFGGVGGSIVVSNAVGTENAQKNNILGNTVRGAGEACIAIQGQNTFGTQVFDNQIRGNNITNCGVGGTAVASSTLFGIALIDFNPTSLANTFIDDNYIRDDQGSPTTKYWLGITGLANGQVFVGKNTSSGVVNPGVFAGISSVTLGAGWGTTATSTFTSYGDSFVVTVTSNGTGQATGALTTVNTVVSTTTQPPVMACQMVSGSGALAAVFAQTPGSFTSASTVAFEYNAVPVAGLTYTILCRG